MQFLAQRYDTHELAVVEIHGERIQHVRAATPQQASTSHVHWVAPGLVDIQVNGYGGQEFSSLELTPEKVATIVRQHFAFGVTRLCPTLTTQSFDVLSHGMRTIDAACQQWPDIERAVAGVHLEGPYFSTEDGPRGAHPVEHCRRPNWDEFQKLQEAAGGRIVVLTMSPEFEESAAFIARIVASGVVVAIGHTSADSDHIRAAVDAGASLSTHLGNGAHRMLRRHPNYIWDQLAEDRLTASLICDGHHLPPEVVKTFVRAKTPARCVLVSDVSGLAGLPVGRYAGSGCELEILADGRLVIAGQDQLLAGASLPLGVGVANVMRFAGVDLRTAVDMASRQPAELLRTRTGGLNPGDWADLALFDLPEDLAGTTSIASNDRTNSGLSILATIAGGRLVYGDVPDEKRG